MRTALAANDLRRETLSINWAVLKHSETSRGYEMTATRLLARHLAREIEIDETNKVGGGRIGTTDDQTFQKEKTQTDCAPGGDRDSCTSADHKPD